MQNAHTPTGPPPHARIATQEKLYYGPLMNFSMSIFAGLFVVGTALGAVAQEASKEPLVIRPSGEAYLKAIRFRRIDSDVAYFDPTQPAPPLNTTEQPKPASKEPNRDARELEGTWETGRVITFLVTGAALALVFYLFAKFGGAASISFGAAPANASRTHGAGRRLAQNEVETPMDLQAILQMPDRRDALVALSRHLLARAIATQGVLLQRSWTAREAMRRIPREFPHRDALMRLVLTSERVHFGGRDVSETEFRDHVAQLEPLYSEATP